MTGSLVLDASALIALLVDAGGNGDWVANTVGSAQIAAPELALFETADVLRRQQLRGDLEPVEATLAHNDLLALPLQLWPYAVISDRAWELRGSMTIFDASYMALAEFLDASVLTLDGRLAGANGQRCPVLTP
ncbi:MAG TPA: type II toxin-antitoxin system VapC family toxin [Jiangellaceae bacterium]